MTSSLAIKPSTDIAATTVPSGEIFKSIPTAPTGRNTLATGSRALTGATPPNTGATGANTAIQLAAGGGMVPRPSPGVQIKVWKNIVQPSVAPGATRPAVFGRSQVFDLPVGGSRTPRGAAAIFSPGSRKVVVPGLPVLTRAVETSLVTNLNVALTAERVAKFKELDPGQQKVARALLEAVIEGMSMPAGAPGGIDPRHMGKLIDLVFKDAKSMTVVDELPLRVQPPKAPKVAVETESRRPAAPIVKTQQPVAPVAPVVKAVESVAPTVQPVQSVKPATPPVAAAETTPAAPTTGAGAIVPTPSATPAAPATPTPATGAQPAVAWPFAGETAPAWFAPAIAYDPNPNSPTYQPDREMGGKVVKLVVDSREFAAQAATIQVTRELTERWNVWKAA